MPSLVVADTGPLHYLVLIGQVGVLDRLFGAVAVPATVAGELRHPNAPDAVRAWISCPPPWLSICDDPPAPAGLERLDPGERAVITLAETLAAGLLLMDDREGVASAREQDFRVTGTLGVLMEAAAQTMLDLDSAFAALRATNFRGPPVLFDALLREHRKRREQGPAGGA